MEGIDALKKKLQLTLLNKDSQTSERQDIATSKRQSDVQTSERQNVKTSERQPVQTSKSRRHKTTLYLTPEEYAVLENVYLKRKMSGEKCDRYTLVGKAIMEVYGPEANQP